MCHNEAQAPYLRGQDRRPINGNDNVGFAASGGKASGG